MCPVRQEAELFAFVIPSPKQRDLLRDGRYALGSFPCEDDEDAFSLAGKARLVTDAGLRSDLGAVFVAERVQFRGAGTRRGRTHCSSSWWSRAS